MRAARLTRTTETRTRTPAFEEVSCPDDQSFMLLSTDDELRSSAISPVEKFETKSFFNFFPWSSHKYPSFSLRIICCYQLLFLPPYAIAGIQTHVKRAAQIRDLLKDALPAELPHGGPSFQTSFANFVHIQLGLPQGDQLKTNC